MASILIAGLLTLVLGFAVGWLAAWVISLRVTSATLSTLWGRVLAGAGVLAALLVVSLFLPGVGLPFRSVQPTPTATPTDEPIQDTEPVATPIAAYPTSTPYATHTPYPTSTPYRTQTP